MSEEEPNLELNKWGRGLWTLGPFSRTVGGGIFKFGVHETMPPEFVKHVVALGAGLFLGEAPSTSIRKAKKYDVEQPDFLALDWQIHFAVERTTKLFSYEVSRPDAPSKDTLNNGMLIEFVNIRAAHALQRAEALAQCGSYYEAMAILRFCIEIMAWSCYLEQDEMDAPISKSPQSCIPYLKKKFASSGRYYGHMSENAHFNARSHLKSLNFDKTNPSILISTMPLKVLALTNVLIVTFMYAAVFERYYQIMYGDNYAPILTSKNVGFSHPETREKEPSSSLNKLMLTIKQSPDVAKLDNDLIEISKSLYRDVLKFEKVCGIVR